MTFDHVKNNFGRFINFLSSNTRASNITIAVGIGALAVVGFGFYKLYQKYQAHKANKGNQQEPQQPQQPQQPQPEPKSKPEPKQQKKVEWTADDLENIPLRTQTRADVPPTVPPTVLEPVPSVQPQQPQPVQPRPQLKQISVEYNAAYKLFSSYSPIMGGEKEFRLIHRKGIDGRMVFERNFLYGDYRDRKIDLTRLDVADLTLKGEVVCGEVESSIEFSILDNAIMKLDVELLYHICKRMGREQFVEAVHESFESKRVKEVAAGQFRKGVLRTTAVNEYALFKTYEFLFAAGVDMKKCGEVDVVVYEELPYHFSDRDVQSYNAGMHQALNREMFCQLYLWDQDNLPKDFYATIPIVHMKAVQEYNKEHFDEVLEELLDQKNKARGVPLKQAYEALGSMYEDVDESMRGPTLVLERGKSKVHFLNADYGDVLSCALKVLEGTGITENSRYDDLDKVLKELQEEIELNKKALKSNDIISRQCGVIGNLMAIYVPRKDAGAQQIEFSVNQLTPKLSDRYMRQFDEEIERRAKKREDRIAVSEIENLANELKTGRSVVKGGSKESRSEDDLKALVAKEFNALHFVESKNTLLSHSDEYVIALTRPNIVQELQGNVKDISFCLKGEKDLRSTPKAVLASLGEKSLLDLLRKKRGYEKRMSDFEKREDIVEYKRILHVAGLVGFIKDNGVPEDFSKPYNGKMSFDQYMSAVSAYVNSIKSSGMIQLPQLQANLVRDGVQEWLGYANEAIQAFETQAQGLAKECVKMDGVAKKKCAIDLDIISVMRCKKLVEKNRSYTNVTKELFDHLNSKHAVRAAQDQDGAHISR